MGKSLIIVKDGLHYDADALVKSYIWSGRNDSPARTLAIEFAEDERSVSRQTGVDIEKGQTCVFFEDKKELFRGILLSEVRNENNSLSVKAYDSGVYLSNNKDSFSYIDKTVSEIFRDVCARFSIPVGEVAASSYRIGSLPRASTTGYDIICEALEATCRATGVRYNVSCENGKVNLIKRSDKTVQWLLASGNNISAYSYEKSFEKTRTRIVLLDSKNNAYDMKNNAQLEAKIGIFQDVLSTRSETDIAKIYELLNYSLTQSSKPSRLLNISAPGNSELISGRCAFVKIPRLNLQKSFYIESDVHTFAAGVHNMSLTLSC